MGNLIIYKHFLDNQIDEIQKCYRNREDFKLVILTEIDTIREDIQQHTPGHCRP